MTAAHTSRSPIHTSKDTPDGTGKFGPPLPILAKGPSQAQDYSRLSCCLVLSPLGGWTQATGPCMSLKWAGTFGQPFPDPGYPEWSRSVLLDL